MGVRGLRRCTFIPMSKGFRRRSRRRPKVGSVRDPVSVVPSYKLHEWVKCVSRWATLHGHEFAGRNIDGVPHAVCVRCGLTISVQGRVRSRDAAYVIRGRPPRSSRQLKGVVAAIISCGDVTVSEVHGS